jgi:hypothetical protein
MMKKQEKKEGYLALKKLKDQLILDRTKIDGQIKQVESTMSLLGYTSSEKLELKPTGSEWTIAKMIFTALQGEKNLLGLNEIHELLEEKFPTEYNSSKQSLSGVLSQMTKVRKWKMIKVKVKGQYLKFGRKDFVVRKADEEKKNTRNINPGFARPNYGIGKKLKEIFTNLNEGESVSFESIYTSAKPEFKKLTEKQLLHELSRHVSKNNISLLDESKMLYGRSKKGWQPTPEQRRKTSQA